MTTVMLLIAKKDLFVIESQTIVAPGCDNGLLGNKPYKPRQKSIKQLGAALAQENIFTPTLLYRGPLSIYKLTCLFHR